MAALVSQYCRQYEERPPEADLRRALTEYLTIVGRRGDETVFAEDANELLGFLAEDAGLVWEFWLPRRKLPDVVIYGRGLGLPSDANIFLVQAVGVVRSNPPVPSYAHACEKVQQVLRYMGHERGHVSVATLRERESRTRKWLMDSLGASRWDSTFDELEARGKRLLRSNPLLTLSGPRLSP